MPRLAYFDCVAGASGDMILGALVDAGVPLAHLQATAAALQLPGLELRAMPTRRGSIGATKVDVLFTPEHEHRHLHRIKEIIQRASLPGEVRSDAIRIFQRLAEAEAKVHRTTTEKIHFHEVGALDAIADVVCAAAGLHYLELHEILVSSFPLGGGTTISEHGVIPVPAPATVELLQGFPSRLGPLDFELVTPTGAAILTTLGRPYSGTPFRTLAVGYGAGNRELETIPNLLRLFIGESETSETTDSVTMIETNIDDMNPEIYPFVIERLLEGGALDAFLAPIIMKKGRPGIMLSVLAPAEKVETVLDLIYTETTTLGVRLLPVGRRKLKRWQETRTTSLGEVRVKIAEWNGKHFLSPEFEECQRLAREKSLPLREVYEKIREELRPPAT